MKVSVNWLREFVDFDISPEELAGRLEMSGTVLEGIERKSIDLPSVKVGLLKEVRRHPNADKLSVCSVDIGIEKELIIVCGAQNVRKGQKVPVVTVGGTLPNNVRIKSVNIRGVKSEGMIASEVELELGEDAAGIMVLEKNSRIGSDIREELQLEDTIMDFEITPNRPDCMSMIGVAREVAAITGGRIRRPSDAVDEEEESVANKAVIEVEDPNLCPRYTARVVVDLEVRKSPFWMRRRLMNAGIRPINNLVDITNYILLETGQPLHAFDLSLINENKIIVRRARAGEHMITLDDEERVLNSDVLVIADPAGSIALAGVMGGATTEINDETKHCLIESAYFDSRNICKTAYSLELRSEASSRFERGTDPNGTVYAANRAARLMSVLAGGRNLKGLIDVYKKKINERHISVRPERANKILGTSIDKGTMVDILESLDLSTNGGVAIDVTVPTFRPDLEREIDLIEEIARIYGYEEIESTLPCRMAGRGGLSQDQQNVFLIRDTLVASGLREIITYSFMDPKDIERLRLSKEASDLSIVKVKNPLSEEQSVLRTTLLPGLLKVIAFNQNHGNENVQIFEIGRVFNEEKDHKTVDEEVRVAGVLTGSWDLKEWYVKEIPRQNDFFDVKGIVEMLKRRLRVGDISINRIGLPFLTQGRSVSIDGKAGRLGYMGQLDPRVREKFGLERDVVVFELGIDKMITGSDKKSHTKIPSRYPSIVHDIAIIVDKEAKAEDISSVMKNNGGKYLVDVHIFDVYEGSQIPEGKKSIAYRLVFRASDKTLKDIEGTKARDRIIKAVKAKFNVEIRSKT